MTGSLISNLWWDPVAHSIAWSYGGRSVARTFGEGLRGVAALPGWTGVVVVCGGRGAIYDADGSVRTWLKLPMPNSVCNMILDVEPEVLVVFDAGGLSYWGRLNVDTGEVEDPNEWR